MPAVIPAAWQQWVFAAQVLSTMAMLGLIWFVQLVHYPLFRRVPPAVFAGFEAEHARRTGWVAAPLMVVELTTSLLLLVTRLRPPVVSVGEARSGAMLAALLWLVTFCVQVPLHNRLHGGFDRARVERLVGTNWVRTVLWTMRAGLLVVWVMRLLR